MSTPLTATITLALTLAIAAQKPADSSPDLKAVPLPILRTARANPEALWSFLLNPSTPYLEACAVAMRCREVFPLQLVRTLQHARWDLEREQLSHGFGVELGETNSSAGPSWPVPDNQRVRRILGRAWVVPEKRTPCPQSWTEESLAPWPWRLQKVLELTWRTITPTGGESQQNRNRAWFTNCLSWPTDNDVDAQFFAVATQSIASVKPMPHALTMGILARWRRIMLDERLPKAGHYVGGMIGSTHRLLMSGEPESQLACQVIAADVLGLSLNTAARQRCAYELRWLRLESSEQGSLPVEALLAAAGRAVEPHTASEHWKHLYVYAFSVCEAIDKPPFPSTRNMGMDSPEVVKLLGQFAQWLAEQRPTLEKQVRARAERVAKVRAQLIELGG